MSLSPQKVDFEAIWKDLAEGVGKIVTLAGVKGMPMYEIIYKLCTAQPHPYSEQLYNRLKKYLEDHVEGVKKVKNLNRESRIQKITLILANAYTSIINNIVPYF
jgi:hypothetical protein